MSELRRRMMVQQAGGGESVPPDNVIWYKTTDNNPITPTWSPYGIISNEFDGEKCVMTFGTAVLATPRFYNRNTLCEVHLPDCVETIYSETFSGTGLKTIRWPQQLNVIGELAFDGDAYDAGFFIDTLPATLTWMGRLVFRGRNNISDVRILNSSSKIDTEYSPFEQNIIIHVPNSLLSQYQADSNWNVYNLVGY